MSLTPAMKELVAQSSYPIPAFLDSLKGGAEKAETAKANAQRKTSRTCARHWIFAIFWYALSIDGVWWRLICCRRLGLGRILYEWRVGCWCRKFSLLFVLKVVLVFVVWRWVSLVFCLGFLCHARFFVSRWVFEDLRTWGPFFSRFMSGGSNFSKGDFVSLGFFLCPIGFFCGRTIKIDDTFGGVEKLYSVIEWSYKTLPSIFLIFNLSF